MHDRLDDMASVLREHCPRLKDLSFTFFNLNDNQAVRLLDNGIKGTLERISISTCRNHLTNRRVLEISEMGTQRALLDHATTLEVLQLTDCGFDITSKWIQQILVQSSRLKELRVETPILGIYPEEAMAHTKMGRHRRALIGLDAMDIVQGAPWACTDLRVRSREKGGTNT